MSAAVAVYRIFDLITLLLVVKIFLSFLPNVNWSNQPFKFLYQFADLFFSPFKKIIPPIGMIDLSPIVVFILLRLFQVAFYKILVSLGV